VFEDEARQIAGAEFLAQGTLYPDVIESVSFKGGPSAVIKSHHNVGGLPDRMKLALVEPLRELFKDEVRQVGLELGLPRHMVWRQPFPARPRGALPRPAHPAAARRAARAEAIIEEEIRAAGLYESIWQSFGVLLPVRSVGVMGDARTYDEALALRAVHSRDGMTPTGCSCRTTCSAGSRRASSTRSAASTAWSTTSPASRPARSNGVRRIGVRRSAAQRDDA